jgi:hypothetical protein
MEFTSDERSCEMQSMDSDVPARKAEGRTPFFAGKQPSRCMHNWGLNRLWPRYK